MGVSSTKWPELIRFSLIDFFTGEVLIDKIVFPSVFLRSLSTPWSGVDWDMMWKAVRQGSCLFGRDAAREAIWKFVGPETVVITHAGENDMNVLRWIHPRVVDTQILGGSQVGLQTLCLRLTGILIQNGGHGHDSLEDTLATREIAHIFLKRLIEMREYTAPTLPTPLPIPVAPPSKIKKWSDLFQTSGLASGSSSATSSRKTAAPVLTSGSTTPLSDHSLAINACLESEDEARLEMVDDGFDGERMNFHVAR